MNVLKLNLSIYPIRFVKRAVEEYLNYTKINIKSISVSEIELEFIDNNNIIKKEFCNYLIYLIGMDV